ncbi:MAG: fibronectin type III domain-containing protein [Planctomycetaceae bacterium]
MHNQGTSSYLNTTISSNVAVSRGGGVFNDGSVSATMINTTIVDNAAGSRGGGIASESMLATRIGNSILERNKTDARVPVTLKSTFKDMMGGVQSLGFNSIQVLDARFASATSAGLLVTDKFGRDATPRADMTNVLQYGAGNGVGFHGLKLNGGAVDAGSNSVYPVNPSGKFDAIGNPRLIEGNGDGIITIDLGAVEYEVKTPLALFVATPNPAGLNELITFDGSKSTLPNPAVGRITLWEWDFDWNPANVASTKPLTDPTYNPYENFTQDATGVSTTHRYTNVNRTSYIVRLIVTDNLGNKGFTDKVVSVGRPSTPVILRPFAITSDLTPTITWQASPATYRLTVDNVTTGQSNVINVGSLTSTSYTPPANLTPGRYRVTVSATNGSGTSTSVPYLFDVTRLTLTSPLVATFDPTPIFRWADVPGSSRYDIWVNRTQTTFKDQVIRNQFVTTNSYEPQVSLGSGTFTWWVRAFDADGVAGDWSISRTFTIGRPAFTAPARVTMNTKPTFTWTNMGAPRYELWVNQVGGTNKIIYQPALTTNSFTPTTALPNGKFDVWVRAIAADGEAGLWSFVYQFQMDYRVGPETVSPVGVTTDTTPTFTWKVIDGAANYDLWVDNITSGTRQVIRRMIPTVNGAAQITYTPATPMAAGNYRWWVQAVTAAGARGAWSVGKDFQIPIPSITTPRGSITTSTPTFRWNGVAEFLTYELWVDNLTTGVTQVLRVQGLTDKFYTPTLPLENGSFRAWVRGFDKDGLASQWSGIADFTINATIGNAPVPTSPRGTISNNKPTFTWQGVTNAAKYEILVKNMSDGGQPVVLNVNNIAGLSYTSTTTLAPNKDYRWWVRAISGNNVPGPWSQPLDFRIVSSDLPLPSDSDSPFDSAQLASVVLTAYAENGMDDEVRSITAHPAGTVVQLSPEAAASFLAESDAAIDHVQPLAEIDAVMEEMALDSFFMSDLGSKAVLPITALAPAPVVITRETATTGKQTTLEAVTAGLLAAMVMPRTVPTRDERRKPQR